jgi:hypothetical protein
MEMRAWRSESPGARAMLPLGRPLRVQLQAGGSPAMGDQQLQDTGSTLLTLRPRLAPQAFRLGFPFALLDALMGLVAMLVIPVHDAS